VKTVLPPLNESNLAMSPQYWQDGCLQAELSVAPKSCAYGDTKDPRLTIALVGDSMSGNWFPALDAIAKQEHWELVTELHGDCTWTATMTWFAGTNSAFTDCKAWGADVLQDLLTKIRPDVVITSGRQNAGTPDSHTGGDQSRREIGDGEATYWEQLLAHGIPVVAIKEGPEGRISEHACVAGHPSDYMTACSGPTAKAIIKATPETYAAAKTGGKVPIVNMNSLICGPKVCPAVVGNVLTLFDTHHMTAAYSQTLAPFLRQKLLAASPLLKKAST
jgi:hypothetical protein